MPKTYNSLTVANAAAGSAILASDHAKAFENINNYRVPPMCRAVRSATDTGYTTEKVISWTAADQWDTESPTEEMHDPASNSSRITFRTSGIYLVTFSFLCDYTGTASYMQARIKGGGSTVIAEDYRTSTAGSYVGQISAHVNSATYAYVEAFLNLAGSTTATFRGDNPALSYFAAAWLGQVS